MCMHEYANALYKKKMICFMTICGVIFKSNRNMRQCYKHFIKQFAFMHNAQCIVHNALCLVACHFQREKSINIMMQIILINFIMHNALFKLHNACTRKDA